MPRLLTCFILTTSLILIAFEPAESINLNYNRGRSSAFGPGGSQSHSDAETYGVQIGLKRPGQNYQPLHYQTGGRSNSISSGRNAPQTWANGHSRAGNGVYGGANAGWRGGHGVNGISQTQSRSRTIAVPVDNQGTTLFSNLQSRKKKPEEIQEDA